MFNRKDFRGNNNIVRVRRFCSLMNVQIGQRTTDQTASWGEQNICILLQAGTGTLHCMDACNLPGPLRNFWFFC